jgi:hypothetical protein
MYRGYMRIYAATAGTLHEPEGNREVVVAKAPEVSFSVQHGTGRGGGAAFGLNWNCASRT